MSAASPYRHLTFHRPTRHRPTRHRLPRMAMGSAPRPSDASRPAGEHPGPNARSL
ncbi:hypothetical protein ACH4VX_17070 [Streptomyces sp. NPDC020731]|uniref:hypothetical protein n=1 Tax=Streptomyces sp. NPDC020731 TaxID=3365085 RepID=UPI0037A41444